MTPLRVVLVFSNLLREQFLPPAELRIAFIEVWTCVQAKYGDELTDSVGNGSQCNEKIAGLMPDAGNGRHCLN